MTVTFCEKLLGRLFISLFILCDLRVLKLLCHSVLPAPTVEDARIRKKEDEEKPVVASLLSSPKTSKRYSNLLQKHLQIATNNSSLFIYFIYLFFYNFFL